ncbi:MAG: SMC-Scp complex subunit ScpB [archaeon]
MADEALLRVNRRLAEAALFISGRGLTVKELLKAVPTLTPARARDAVESLVGAGTAESALEVVREVGQEIKYKMKVKDEFLSQVRRLSNFTDLSDGETKTLAVIAFYQPIKQSEIVKIRGNRAYEQVKNLVGSGLVVAEPKGITRLLRTTERFADYFGAPLESLKGKLDAKDKAIIDGAVETARAEISAEEAATEPLSEPAEKELEALPDNEQP